MIGRGNLLQCDAPNFAASQKINCKTGLPQPQDATFFKHIAEGERVKLASTKPEKDSDNLVLLSDEETQITLSDTVQTTMLAPSFFIGLNINMVSHEKLGGDEKVAIIFETESDLTDLLPDRSTQKPDVVSQKNVKDIDKKMLPQVQQNSPHAFSRGRIIEDIKSKMDVTQIATQKLDDNSAFITQAGINISPNSLPNPIQAMRVLDIPHVTRVQIDHVKRTSAGVLTSLELVLEPAELGRITARIEQQEGRLVLLLSAEHQHTAEELSRDSGLLIRALGDNIPGIDKMAVIIQTQASSAQNQTFADLGSGHQKQNRQTYIGARLDIEETKNGGLSADNYTTSSRILI